MIQFYCVYGTGTTLNQEVGRVCSRILVVHAISDVVRQEILDLDRSSKAEGQARVYPATRRTVSAPLKALRQDSYKTLTLPLDPSCQRDFLPETGRQPRLAFCVCRQSIG